MYLYRIVGLKKEYEFAENDIKAVLYLEAKSFQNATTKAKKLLTHTYKVEQIQGELVEEM